jgi:aminoglycoside phosphotransferase (APT) family kinase protein
MNNADLAAKLQSLLTRRIGSPGTVGALKRLTGGATKQTWSFRAQIARRDVPLILQLVSKRPPGIAVGVLPRLGAREDAALIAAAAGIGVPTPTVRLVLAPEDGIGEGIIMDQVPGETIARRILREEAFTPLRATFAAQCGTLLARVHQIDPAKLPFLRPFGSVAQLEGYRRIYDALDHPQPVIELGLRWAQSHVPHQHPLRVVHGDFRLGNLICGQAEIAAVIDWELATVGDPLQDLGWLCVKTWRFGGSLPVAGIGRREDLVAAYEHASGTVVNARHLRFWEGFGSLKWAIMCLMIAHRGQNGDPPTLEQLAIGRRLEEPLYDFLQFLAGED